VVRGSVNRIQTPQNAIDHVNLRNSRFCSQLFVCRLSHALRHPFRSARDFLALQLVDLLMFNITWCN